MRGARETGAWYRPRADWCSHATIPGDAEISELSVRALCSNRHLTENLPVGQGGAGDRAGGDGQDRTSARDSRSVREAYDSFKMGVPVLGNLVRMFVLTKFLRVFAALYRGGFSMGSALEVAGASCGNAVLWKAASHAVGQVERGGLVSDALRASGFFPSMAIDMFRTGETTGNLDDMLNKMADYYEAEARTKTHQAALIFSIIVFLIVALLVALSVINFYMSYAGATTGGGE